MREQTAINRFGIMGNAYDLFKQKPIWGFGIINFTSLTMYNYGAVIHNGLMYKLASTGIVGFIPYICSLLIILYMSIYLIKSTQNQIIKTYTSALLLGYCACIIELFFYRNVGHSFMWIVMGLICALYKIDLQLKNMATDISRDTP